jgi:hypothetical protein
MIKLPCFRLDAHQKYPDLFFFEKRQTWLANFDPETRKTTDVRKLETLDRILVSALSAGDFFSISA